MKHAGAAAVDVTYPKWLIDAKDEFYSAIRYPALGPKYPKSLDEMIEHANRFTATPDPSRWALFKREANSGTLDDYRYTSVRDYALPMMRTAVEGVLASRKGRHRLSDFFRRPGLLSAPPDLAGGGRDCATSIANLTGFPDLIVPAGFTGDRLPVCLWFFGPALSDQKLLSLGYGFEQSTKARRRPAHPPPLAGESIPLP
jgi:amidase